MSPSAGTMRKLGKTLFPSQWWLALSSSLDWLIANDESDTKWMIYGLSEAGEKLVKGGEYDAFGTLLCALETIVPPSARVRSGH